MWSEVVAAAPWVIDEPVWIQVDHSLMAETHALLVSGQASNNKAQTCQHLVQQQAWVRGQAQPMGSKMAQPNAVEGLV